MGPNARKGAFTCNIWLTLFPVADVLLEALDFFPFEAGLAILLRLVFILFRILSERSLSEWNTSHASARSRGQLCLATRTKSRLTRRWTIDSRHFEASLASSQPRPYSGVLRMLDIQMLWPTLQ